MRRIHFSKCGIHFETEVGQINAHWDDMVGISTYARRYERKITFDKYFIKMFWYQIGEGIYFIITKKFGYQR